MKKGFTLIELMVVIVIIGILAAIAVPKMFGMSARAKASEVGTAAGTYKKLQDMYVLEQSDLGNATSIGYEPPQSQSILYAIAGSTPFAFTATVQGADLNANCQVNDVWTLTPALGGGAVVTWDATTGTNTDCLLLTPSFTKLAN